MSNARRNNRQNEPMVRAGSVTVPVGIDPTTMPQEERDRIAKMQADSQNDAAKMQEERVKADRENRDEELAKMADEQGKVVIDATELDKLVADAVAKRLESFVPQAGPLETITMPSPAAASQAVLEERARMGMLPFAPGSGPATALPSDAVQEVRKFAPTVGVNGTITEVYEGGKHIGFSMPTGPRVIEVDGEAPSASE